MSKKYINTIVIGAIAIGTEVTKETIGDRWDSFVEEGYIVEAPEKVVNEVSDCSELQTELESAKEAIATKDSQLAERDGVIVDLEKKIEVGKEEAQKAYGELVEDLAAAEKIADLKALQAKYPVEA